MPKLKNSNATFLAIFAQCADVCLPGEMILDFYSIAELLISQAVSNNHKRMYDWMHWRVVWIKKYNLRTSSQFPISFPGRNQKGNANRLQLNGNCCSVLLSRMCQYWNEIYHQKDESFRETKEDFYLAKSGLVTNPILLSQESFSKARDKNKCIKYILITAFQCIIIHLNHLPKEARYVTLS